MATAIKAPVAFLVACLLFPKYVKILFVDCSDISLVSSESKADLAKVLIPLQFVCLQLQYMCAIITQYIIYKPNLLYLCIHIQKTKRSCKYYYEDEDLGAENAEKERE